MPEEDQWSMIEHSGKRVPQKMRDHFLALAREDPTLTNAELSQKTSEIFERKVDRTTVGVYRRRAGIQSSKKARAAVKSKIVLSATELENLRRLVEKITLPPPDAMRMTDTIWATGLGHVGTARRKLWIEHIRGKIAQIWLLNTDEEWLLQALPSDSLRELFAELMGQGRATIQKIITHNSAIDNGQGEIPISEVLELSRTRDPKTFNALDRPPYELWLEHVALAKAVELFKLAVETHFSPPPVHRTPPN